VSDTVASPEAVLEEITRELAALVGGSFGPRDVRVEVDLFEGAEPLVGDHWLDSMDVVQLVAVLEDRFGVDLAEILTGDEPMTLVAVAEWIAGARS
jgi:acyl carrier protein